MPDNVPVRLEVLFVVSTRVGDHTETFSVSSGGGVGAVNPFEHASTDSFLADCEHTTKRWVSELRAALEHPDLAAALAPRLATAVTRALAANNPRIGAL
jgi:hypothetical protein